MVPSKPWYGNWESEEVSYKEVYDDSITFNKYAKRMVYSRLKWNLKQDRYPALVVCKFIAHCENLCKYFKKKLGSKYNIACVHVDTPSKIRQQIMKDFREGKIDILVSTTIIARGKNFPKLRYLLNAASMDSQENLFSSLVVWLELIPQRKRFTLMTYIIQVLILIGMVNIGSSIIKNKN